MGKNRNNSSDSKTKNGVFVALNLILALITMILVLIVITRIIGNDKKDVSLFISISILSLVCHQIILFFMYKKRNDKLRVIVVGTTYLVAAVFGFLAREHYVFFYISTFLVTTAMGLNQFLTISKEKTKTGILTNILFGSVLLSLGVAVIITLRENQSIYIPLVAALLLLFDSIRRLLLPSLKYEKVKLLLNILVKTHAFDVLVCLLAFVIAFSFMFPMVEENITNFWDAMWYCFTVITTIGFGDFAATSVVGRILTVVLGIYGIIVVAILTSVIVNFYTEVSAKERDKSKDYVE